MIYLVRHGQTDANDYFYAGQQDIPLNRTGLIQAEELVVKFQLQTIDLIMSSPLQRAIQTATPLAKNRRIEIQSCAQLVELNFGDLQGLPKTAHKIVLRRDHLYKAVPNGESLFDLWQRLELVCACLLANVTLEKSIVVVGHYWTNRLLYGRLTGNSLEDSVRLRDYRPKPGNVFPVTKHFEEMS